MTRLILMRHGNTFEEGQTPVQVGARTDLPLTAFGRSQAERMAQYLMAKGIVPKAIFAGGLKRQTESASIIGKFFGLNFENTSALTEIDYGLWEGLTAEEIDSKWPKEHAEWSREAKWQSHIFHGSAQGHQRNLKNWIEMIQKAYPNETVLGVTSNGLLRFFRNEKVKTGHFCEFQGTEIVLWNQNPSNK
ncbi:MAG: phosphoglycerate mutase family protein [Parachlamydiales bacterium]|nr:phosphoglycerate mutase family protein [Parachlamydiales bacterium]